MQKILAVSADGSQFDPLNQVLKDQGVALEHRSCVISGLEHAVATHPDIILIADDFSGLRAKDFLEFRQDDPILADIPTVVLHDREEAKREYFRFGCDEFVLLPADETELAFRIRALLRRTHVSGISGDLAHVSILDVIQMLIASRSDGYMTVEAGGHTGALVFEAGHVTHAEWCEADSQADKLEGKQALLGLLRTANNGGRFSFAAEKREPARRTINERTDHILLGLANIIDESSASSR